MIYAERVEAIYLNCIYSFTDADRLYWVVINPDGVRITLHPARVGSHLGDIEAILEMFPAKFYAVNGPGAPISEACYDRAGNIWASDMSFVNMILVLGVAIGRVKLYSNPENCNFMWSQIS